MAVGTKVFQRNTPPANVPSPGTSSDTPSAGALENSLDETLVTPLPFPCDPERPLLSPKTPSLHPAYLRKGDDSTSFSSGVVFSSFFGFIS